ncbi:MAG: hypoxanthine-guanine phosphoribosyltransferase [Proteobacteria bacterium]|nr:hypoxanthine-guanine phosphoribosyltransferase [Pseudomonadota bacterium]
MPDLKGAWSFLEASDQIASAQTVQAAIARLATEIHAQYRDAYPLVLAVMGGAVVFAGQLLPQLRFPLDFDYIHVSRYGDATQGGKLVWRVSPGAAVRGRQVLVLDDILDGGETMAGIRSEVNDAGAAGFSCAVLVEKRLRREKPIRPDFIGFEVPDRFVFGCGMDARGLWRNLPEIRAMKEQDV